MRERMTKPGWLLVGLTVALLSLATMPAQAQLGVIPGISGSTFNLSTGTGHITTPDGDSLLIWGYGSGVPQYPGPTLIVNQGDTVTINLTNNLPQPTSIVFPGQGDDPTTPADESVTASGGTCPGASGCLLTAEAAAGGYGHLHLHGDACGHVHVSQRHERRAADRDGAVRSDHRAADGFDQDERTAPPTAPPTPTTSQSTCSCSARWTRACTRRSSWGCTTRSTSRQYDPRLWFLNGRNAPDTLADSAGIPWMPHQPYNALPIIHPGERLLARFIGASHHLHPLHTHGNNFNVIAHRWTPAHHDTGRSGRDRSGAGSEPIRQHPRCGTDQDL